MKKKDINLYYWCPVLSNVATVRAVLNSAIATNRYSKNIKVSLIDTLKEWDNFKSIINDKIEIKKIVDLSFFFPKYGFFMRLNYIKIFIYSFFPLLRLLKKDNPDYIVVHLITSLPLILKVIFNFKTKIILRISGLPRLNFFRKTLWRLVSKKIDIITTPTEGTLQNLKKEKIFNERKIHLLRDPVISISKINKLKKQNIDKEYLHKPFILSIGRLSKQKNQKLIIENFKNNVFDKYNLIIVGEGELEDELKMNVKKLFLEDRIKFAGYHSNIYKFLLKSELVIISSLWEDPGWVMIEAAACNVTVLSSDCNYGPKEFLNNNEGGFIFKTNSSQDLIQAVEKFNLSEEKEKNKKKLFLKKQSKNYTFLKHFLELNNIINKN